MGEKSLYVKFGYRGVSINFDKIEKIGLAYNFMLNGKVVTTFMRREIQHNMKVDHNYDEFKIEIKSNMKFYIMDMTN